MEQNDTMTEDQHYAAVVQAWEAAKVVADEIGLTIACVEVDGIALAFRITRDDFELQLDWNELGPWLLGYQACLEHQSQQGDSLQ